MLFYHDLQGSRHVFFEPELAGIKKCMFLARTCRDQDMHFILPELAGIGSRHAFQPELAEIKTCFCLP